MNYEEDNETFSAAAYTVAGWGAGIAWHVWGWETEPDEDTEWSGMERRTGRVVATMVGDDCRFAIDPEDLTPIEREGYCGVCGQVGCCHDGYDRREI
jgi:hypothetical protein